MGDGQITERQVDALVAHVKAEIGTDPKKWESWPGGWPGEIGTALVDAVFSARGNLSSSRGGGVRAQVTQWRSGAGDACSSLSALRAQIAVATPHGWAVAFGNEQHSPGRFASAQGGPTMAAAVLEGATLLGTVTPPVDAASDVTETNADQVRQMLRGVPGVGFATSNYFLMLLGLPGVPADRMLHRFISLAMPASAEPRRLSDAAAQAVLDAAAVQLGVEGIDLEHAIWKHERDRGAGVS